MSESGLEPRADFKACGLCPTSCCLSCLALLIFFFFFNIYLFIFGCVGSLLLCAGFLQLRRAGATLRCVGFSLRWLLLLRSTGSRHTGFSSCGSRAQQLWHVGCRAQAQQLWRTGVVAPWHMGSSQTKAWTHVPYLGRRVLNHWATREAQPCLSIDKHACN